MVKTVPGAGGITDSHGAEHQSRQTVAEHYRRYAGELRDLAEDERDPVIRRRLLSLAQEYEERANQLDPPR